MFRIYSSFLPLLHLTCSSLFGTGGSFDVTADVDVVDIAAAGQVVPTAVGFGERRQVKGEPWREAEDEITGLEIVLQAFCFI